ncbi:TPA: hypothetical protein L4559_005129 [Pseudomonas aeruginosa]|nr:hypothetical protein [Pseudomonas aeruginosa]
MNFILKRVPLSFNWPLYQPWKGYINEHEEFAQDCTACGGCGLSSTALRLQDLWYGQLPFRPQDRGGVPLMPSDPHVIDRAARLVNTSPTGYYGSGEAAIEREANRLCILWNSKWRYHLNVDDVSALLEADRLWEFTREFVPGKGNVPKESYVRPTPEQVNIWNIETTGHDDTNCWICCKAECERIGASFGCEHCEDGKVWASTEAKAAASAWLRTQPPEGGGYQMWASIDAGYPVSPVLGSPEEMTTWLAANELKGG